MSRPRSPSRPGTTTGTRILGRAGRFRLAADEFSAPRASTWRPAWSDREAGRLTDRRQGRRGHVTAIGSKHPDPRREVRVQGGSVPRTGRLPVRSQLPLLELPRGNPARRSSRSPGSSVTRSRYSRAPRRCSSGATTRTTTHAAGSVARSSTRSCATAPMCTSRWGRSSTSRASGRPSTSSWARRRPGSRSPTSYRRTRSTDPRTRSASSAPSTARQDRCRARKWARLRRRCSSTTSHPIDPAALEQHRQPEEHPQLITAA